MKIKQIILEDFKCYKKQEVVFKEGVNLLIGDNASGKTSILRACKYILSSFFVGFSDENTNWIPIQSNDYRRSLVSDNIVRLSPVKVSFVFNKFLVGDTEQLECSISNSGKISASAQPRVARMQYLERNTRRNSRTSIAGIRVYKEECARLEREYFDGDKRVRPLPLFAYFPAKDYENTNVKDKKKFKQYYHIPSFGYYECLDDSNNFNNWINRLLILAEGEKNIDEIYVVRRAIFEALGCDGCNIIFSMDIRVIQGIVYYILGDEREVESDNLSDGYKRLVNIVTDLAFRCAHLNGGIYGTDCCKETSGTVLIDEIDLHLHPTLQSTVLKGLRNAFPKLQFIVTSHAPMVMSSVESNNENIVYKLDYSSSEGYCVNEVVTYGMDISTISETVLEQPPRDKQTDIKLTDLFDLIDEGRDDEAIVKLNQMKLKYSNIPDLSRAEAMLNCRKDCDEEN
ncbi:MAG: AAA family ATPase [Rikenellaceae bacterium]